MKKLFKFDADSNSLEATSSFGQTVSDAKSAVNAADGGPQYDYLILGDGPAGVYSMDPQESLVNNNVMAIAGTGGGKTKSVVEANLLHARHQSMVVLLTKRRLMDQYSDFMKKKGYDIKVLDLVNPDASGFGYDPMLHVHDGSDLMALAKGLVACTEKNTADKDLYWPNSAASLFCAFAKLAIHKYGHRARMKHVLYLLRHIHVECSERYDDESDMYITVSDCCPKEDFERLKEKDPKMYSDWIQYRQNADSTRDCIRSILLMDINTIMTDGICRLMAMEKQLDFRELVNRKTVLFILTSPVNPSLHPFANLVFGNMFKELFEYGESLPGGRLPIPLTAICDDFATGGQIPDFQHHISIFREKGISVMMLVKSLSQLEAMYGHSGAVTIMDNTDNLVYLGGNDYGTAMQIGQRINKPADEVLALPIGQEYLFRRGQKPLQLKRYQIFNDLLYRQEFASKLDPSQIRPVHPRLC